MTLTRLEDLQLQAALLAQQLVELPQPSPAAAGDLLQRLAAAVRDGRALVPTGEPLVDLRLREIDQLMAEAATSTHDEPRWRATMQDLRSALEQQALADRRPQAGGAAAAL